jgi:hypothetical protein
VVNNVINDFDLKAVVQNKKKNKQKLKMYITLEFFEVERERCMQSHSVKEFDLPIRAGCRV